MKINLNFNGKIVLRKDEYNERIIQTIKTKKTDDKKMIEIASTICNYKKFPLTRKVLSEKESSQMENAIEKAIEQKLPKNNFTRSMLINGKESFLFLSQNPIVFLHSELSPLAGGGVCIDFHI